MIINYVLQIIDFGWVSLWTLDHAHFLWRKTFVRNISLFCKPTSLHCEYYKPGIFFLHIMWLCWLNPCLIVIEFWIQSWRMVSKMLEIGYHFLKRMGIISQRDWGSFLKDFFFQHMKQNQFSLLLFCKKLYRVICVSAK